MAEQRELQKNIKRNNINVLGVSQREEKEMVHNELKDSLSKCYEFNLNNSQKS